MKRLVALALMAVVLVGCASTTITPGDVTSPQTWGAATNVTRLKHLYFSEQPDEAAFAVAKSRGVTTVISLRGESEIEWDERGAAERQDLAFVSIPVSKNSDTFDSEAILQISKVVTQQEGAPVLLHCSSGNRAAAWLAIHLVDDHALPVNEAVAVARRAGLTHSGVEQRVRTYLSVPPQ